MPIDRLVTDREAPVARTPAGDLFRAPVRAEPRIDARLISGRQVRVATRVRPSAAGIPLGQLWAIVATRARAIPRDLARDRAAMPPQRTGDRRGTQPLDLPHAQRVPFGSGELAVRQSNLALGGEGNLGVPQVAVCLPWRVALTM